MKSEDHKRNINESIEVITESIKKGLQERQRTIGFNVSVAATEMLEVYLHKQNILNPGAILKHEWFSSLRKAQEKIPFDFPKKETLFKILADIESKRNLLCYGKPQPTETIAEVLELFNKLKSLLEEEGLSWN